MLNPGFLDNKSGIQSDPRIRNSHSPAPYQTDPFSDMEGIPGDGNLSGVLPSLHRRIFNSLASGIKLQFPFTVHFPCGPIQNIPNCDHFFGDRHLHQRSHPLPPHSKLQYSHHDGRTKNVFANYNLHSSRLPGGCLQSIDLFSVWFHVGHGSARLVARPLLGRIQFFLRDSEFIHVVISDLHEVFTSNFGYVKTGFNFQRGIPKCGHRCDNSETIFRRTRNLVPQAFTQSCFGFHSQSKQLTRFLEV